MAFSGHTCITCSVAFHSGEFQRAHYKTDWHRYNLKRKVAELPPVTAEDFKQKVLIQRAADAKSRERRSHYCEACRKAFSSDKSYESHLRSKKHKEKESSSSVPASEADDGIADAVGGGERSIEQTLDDLQNRQIEPSNISIAAQSRENIAQKDLPTISPTVKGPDETKGSKVDPKLSIGMEEDMECDSDDSDEGPQPLEPDECLFCPHLSADMEQSLKHMSRMHGFFIPDLEYLVDLKGLMEYLGYKVGVERACLYCRTNRMFYSVEAVQHHMVDKSHCKLFFEGDHALEYAEFYDYTKSYKKQGQEEEVDKEEGEQEADLPVPDNSLEVNEDLELVLPSGTKLSHRAMKQYYKQRLPTIAQRTTSVVTRLMAQYRAIGWRGEGGEAGKKAARDKTQQLRMQQRRDLKLCMKANKQQPHLRPQVVF